MYNHTYFMSPAVCNLCYKGEESEDSYKPFGFFLNPIVYFVLYIYIYNIVNLY